MRVSNSTFRPKRRTFDKSKYNFSPLLVTCLIAALILSLRCVNAVKSDTGRVHHTISLTVPQATFVAHKIDDDLQLQEGWPPVVKHERLLWKFEYEP